MMRRLTAYVLALCDNFFKKIIVQSEQTGLQLLCYILKPCTHCLCIVLNTRVLH